MLEENSKFTLARRLVTGWQWASTVVLIGFLFFAGSALVAGPSFDDPRVQWMAGIWSAAGGLVFTRWNRGKQVKA